LHIFNAHNVTLPLIVRHNMKHVRDLGEMRATAD
jgi:hypothetical protein